MSASPAELLDRAGLPGGDAYDLPTSPLRFPDGAEYRVEIPSVEGPRCLDAVLETARELGVTVTRVSQGTGVGLTTDAELDQITEVSAREGIEVSLFAGRVPGGERRPWRAAAQARC